MPDTSATNQDAARQGTTRNDLLEAIAAERAFWEALVAEVERDGLMDRAGTNNGPWTFRDMAVHLNGWRALTLARLEAARRDDGPPPFPWPAHLNEDVPGGVDAINDWFLEQADGLAAMEVLDRTIQHFNGMTAAVSGMSEAELFMPGRFGWLGDWPVGPALLGFSFIHLHIDHEPDIRAWFTREAGRDLDLPTVPAHFGFDDRWAE